MKTWLGAGIVLCVLSAALTPTVWGDVITTADGQRITGRAVATETGYEITLPDGMTRQIAAQDVVAVEFSPTLLEQFAARQAALNPADAEAHFQLGQWALQQGLTSQSLAMTQTALTIDPDHEKANNLLGRYRHDGAWLTLNEMMEAKGFVKTEAGWMTRAEKEWMDARASASKNNTALSQYSWEGLGNPDVLEEVRQFLASQSEADQKAFLTSGLGHPVAPFRAFCARELGRFPQEDTYYSLVQAALLDGKRDVRDAAVSGIQRLSQAIHVDAEPDFIKSLNDERAEVRIAATDALAQLGGANAVETLVRNYRITYGGGPRAYVAFLRQEAYVEDYDVQVATAAVIADPVVGVLQTGTVLDAQSLGVVRHIQMVERRRIENALNTLTSGDAEPLAAAAESMESFNAWAAKLPAKYHVKGE